MPHGQRQARDARVAVKRVEYRGTANRAGRVLQRVKANYRWAVPHLRIDTAPILELVSSEILRSSTSGGATPGAAMEPHRRQRIRRIETAEPMYCFKIEDGEDP